jgi:hypothetical protein
VKRGQRVLLDEDLAAIYGASTSALNHAMRRNRSRFPPDFVMELTASEWESLRSQIVILKTERRIGRAAGNRTMTRTALLGVGAKEWQILRSQFVTLRIGHDCRKKASRPGG